MAKQFKTLFRSLSDMSDEELQEHIKGVRARKFVERPAAAARKEKAAKPAQKRVATNLLQTLKGLSPEQIKVLLGD